MDQKLTILLVEDDSDTRQNLSDILEIDGHAIHAVGSAFEAKEIARDLQAQIIILDRKLPDGRAEDLLPDLARLIPGVHVIVVTGYADLDGTIAAFRAGAADFILKPINPDALRNSIQRIARTRHAELELRQKQEFSDRIFRTADAIILVLDLNGNVVQFNNYLGRMTGWTDSDLIGANWFDKCIPEYERERIREVFIQTAREASSQGIVNPILTKDGGERQVRWSNNTLSNQHGETNAVLAVGIDITDYTKVQEQLLRSERLAGIGQTMAALAHESRNALQRIHAGVEMLEEITANQDDTKQDLGIIKRAARDLNGIMEEVRSFAAPITLDLEACDLVEIFRQAWRNVLLASDHREIEFIEQLENASEMVHVDALRIEQVFRNLFENALAACEDPVRICVKAWRDEEWYRFVVSDNGPGFTPDQTERIFEPFYTTKSAGTGLGMAIVKRIIIAHQGSVDVMPQDPSHPGAQVAIKLPIKSSKRNRTLSLADSS